ncbi:MAG: hypothetical protein OXF88_18210 [Rhodobacteraceae bacterium]|nr:hypothetical protein [Paracoccaceae bacterium]
MRARFTRPVQDFLPARSDQAASFAHLGETGDDVRSGHDAHAGDGSSDTASGILGDDVQPPNHVLVRTLPALDSFLPAIVTPVEL